MIAQPAIPASPATVANPYGQSVLVTVTGGTVSSINVPAGGTQVATATNFTATVPAGSSIGVTYSVVPTGFWWSPFTPAMPATTVPVTNNTGQDITVVLAGGTTTHIAVNGTDRGTTTPANVMVPNGATIAITYSAAPVWAWLNFPNLDVLDSLGSAYASNNTVSPSGSGGYDPRLVLPYAPHAEAATAGLGTGVTN